MESPGCKRKLYDANNVCSPSPKRARKNLTLQEKIDLISDSEKIPKLTQKEISVKYDIGRATVSDILKRKDFYKQQYEENSELKKKRFCVSSKYGELNELVFKWFSQARAKNVPISGPILQEKALQFARELSLCDFKASNGWLESWRNRYSIGFFKVCGESADVNMETVADYKLRLPEICTGYSPENIFNCDETGLFFRAIPDKSLSRKGFECKGGKLAKERITVMMCCSMEGEKLKPLVIGKANRPRCFKNIKIDNLPVYWRSNKKSWMTTDIFIEWIKIINKDMKKQSRQILLFMDNATSHQDIKLSNVQLKFLPANTTSKTQPLDLGIIQAFKARYRKHMMRHLVSKIDQCKIATELTKSISLLDAVYWIKTAWSETNPLTIQKCFHHAGFPIVSPVTEDIEDPDDDLPLNMLVLKASANLDFDACLLSNIEQEIPIEDTYDDKWEEKLVEDALQKSQDINSDSDDELNDDKTGEACEMSIEDVLGMLDKIRTYAISKDDKYLTPVEHLRSLAHIDILKRESKKTQVTLDHFFTPRKA